jgi:hypothetical protein
MKPTFKQKLIKFGVYDPWKKNWHKQQLNGLFSGRPLNAQQELGKIMRMTNEDKYLGIMLSPIQSFDWSLNKEGYNAWVEIYERMCQDA